MTAADVYSAAKEGAKAGFKEAFAEAMKANFSQIEAANLLNVTPMTIHRWIKSGKISANKNGKIARSEVIRLLTE